MLQLTPEYIKNLKPYVAGKTIAEVQEMYNPERIAKLASNENRLGCSPKIKAAVEEAMQVVQDYPDPASRMLRKTLSRFYGVTEEKIVCASGSEGVMSLFTRAFLQEGDHVITASATFIGFLVLANIQGAKIQRVPLTNDYRFDVKAISDAVNEDTKVIYIANPNNPTGTIISKEEYEWLLNNTPDHVLIVMDEAYYEYAKDSEEYPDSLINTVPRVISFRTFSKAYGLAGLRAGYAIGDPELIGIMTKIKPPFDPSVVAQYAAKSAILDQDFISKSVSLVNDGRQHLYHFLEDRGISFVKSYSNSVMIPFGSEEKAAAFTEAMMKKGVILRRLPGFGLPDCVRITIGLPEEMNYFEEKFDEIWPKL